MLDWFNQYISAPHFWGFIASVPFIAAGFVGLVLPVLPDTVLIMCGFLIYGFITGFENLSLVFFIFQAMLVALSYLVEFVAAGFGVKMYGGSRAAVWGAVFGTLLIFVIGPIGIIIGPLAGAVIGELLIGEQLKPALQAGFGGFVGFVGGTLAKSIICMVMVVWFLFCII